MRHVRGTFDLVRFAKKDAFQVALCFGTAAGLGKRLPSPRVRPCEAHPTDPTGSETKVDYPEATVATKATEATAQRGPTHGSSGNLGGLAAWGFCRIGFVGYTQKELILLRDAEMAEVAVLHMAALALCRSASTLLSWQRVLQLGACQKGDVFILASPC